MRKLLVSALAAALLTASAAAIGNVPENAWYHDAVYFVEKENIYDFHGSFVENLPVSKNDVIKAATVIHAKLSGKDAPSADYLEYAIQNGLIADASKFSQDSPATRGFTALIFSKLIKKDDYINNISFIPDIGVFSCYHDAVFALYNAGVFTGVDENGLFSSGRIITVEQLSAVSERILDKTKAVRFSLENTVSLDKALELYSSDMTDTDKNIIATTDTGFNVSEAMYKYIKESCGENANDESIDTTIRTYSAFMLLLDRYSFVIPQKTYDELKSAFDKHWSQVKPLIEQNSYNISKYSYFTNYWVSMYYQQLYYDYIYQYTPTDKEIYDRYKDDYAVAKHILITFDANTEEAKKAALLSVNSVMSKIKAGEDFDKLIEEYGKDPGMKSFPDGYLFTFNEMVKPFETATFALKDNEISDIVESEYGYHIIKRLPLTEERFLSEKELCYNLSIQLSMENFDKMFEGIANAVKINYTSKP